MGKKIISLAIFLLIMLQFSASAFAADAPATVLPETDKTVTDCEILMSFVGAGEDDVKDFVAGKIESSEVDGLDDNLTVNDVLGCGIKTGNIKLWMVPFYIKYILQFILGLAGLITVGAIVYGGFFYMFAGVSDDKDRGKKAIFNGIIGFVLTLIAWSLVNIVIALVTGTL